MNDPFTRLSDETPLFGSGGVARPRFYQGMYSYAKGRVHPDDETCSFCDESAVAIILGGANCGYCGNQVNLCAVHLKAVIEDLLTILNEQLGENA